MMAPITAAVPASAAQLQAELQIEQSGFDPAYAFSDDHTFWREQIAKAARISELQRQLAIAKAAEDAPQGSKARPLAYYSSMARAAVESAS